MNLQEELIKTAVKLFEERGYARTSVQDIVTVAGVTKGAFYHYFTGKEDVLMMLHEQYINHLLGQSREISSRPDLGPKAKLRELMKILLGEIAQYGGHAKVFFQEKNHLHPDHLELIREKRDEYFLLFEKVVREGIESGDFRSDLDPVITTLGVLGICNWSYRWFRPDGKYSSNEVANMFGEMIERGISS
ncbi:TetR/AcrR family transcriptional regulator [Effusibacillus lacus]|uniref:TetR family transcriptional regulator n=1 Tax=Effusibacillus lacus TaxID=1348429 RepID=A0A292YN15_9BACL|nr:TetR/AcrR family transcriptional regulator [Effusibacillus lacus]TCS75350.1 TetR family transcriptional regulator [Effusibacillus lacus]GAX89784.1 TetR family transcriptional regulator [Effusibacillus lacus]